MSTVWEILNQSSARCKYAFVRDLKKFCKAFKTRFPSSMLVRLQKLQANVGEKEEASAEAEELGLSDVRSKRKDPNAKYKEVCVCAVCVLPTIIGNRPHFHEF